MRMKLSAKPRNMDALPESFSKTVVFEKDSHFIKLIPKIPIWSFVCYHTGMDIFRPDLQPSTPQSGSSLHDAIKRVETGYPFDTFTQLAETLELPQSTLAALLDISNGTLQRRRGGRFNTAESGRLYQLEQLIRLSEYAIGNAEDAHRWLRTPNQHLGDTPLALARTTPGLEAVRRYLEQIADGVYL